MSRGDLWSFIRSCMLQGQDIALDYRDRGYEAMSARLDEAASERADKLYAQLNGQTFQSETEGDPRRCDCWDKVNALIVQGPLQGNGWDKTAERNGLIIAANTIAPFVQKIKEDDRAG